MFFNFTTEVIKFLIENVYFQIILAIATILGGLSAILYFKEKLQRLKWGSVNKLVYKSLGDEIKGISIDLSNLCKNIDVDNNRLIFYNSEDKNLLDGAYGDLFIIRKDHLKEIEQKYFKFLAPSIISSLIKIQKYLYSLDIEIKIRNKNIALKSPYTIPDEEILKTIKKIMLDIFKEIDSLHNESNLKSYIGTS